jgi:predicted MFS family arabinose efflux permease
MIQSRLDRSGLAAAISLGTLGGLTIMAVPGFVGLIGSLSKLDDQSLGYVASWDINAMAATIGLGTFLISRFNWKHLALLALAVMAVGNLWTAYSQDYVPIILSRLCAGSGEGLAIAVSFAALGSAPNPDRAFGIYLVIGLTVSAGILALLPLLEAGIGAFAIFLGYAFIILVSGLLMRWLPARSPAVPSGLDSSAPVEKRLAIAGLSGVFLYFIAQGAMWSYFDRIGAANGIDPEVVGQAMGISSVSGTGGALLSVILCSRVSRSWLLAFSGGLSLASFWLLAGTVTEGSLFAAGILFNFGWNVAQPLLSGLCSEADRRGRVVVAMGCIQTVGFGLGPALTAMLLTGHDFVPAAWMSTGVLVASLAIVVAGLKGRGLPPLSAL